MNLIILQDRIVNLDNVTCIKRYKSGDKNPAYPIIDTRFAKPTIQVEFNTSAGGAEGFDATFEQFEYGDEPARDRDWRQLCKLAGPA